MSIQSLPPEIVKLVIESLASKKDLSSLSLASSHFLSLARPVLFSSIRLPKSLEDHGFRSAVKDMDPEFDCNVRDYKGFIVFLTKFPHLALYVRDLTLWEGPLDHHGGPSYILTPLSLNFLHWMLSKLPSLRSLWLHMIRFKSVETPVPHRCNSIDRVVISCPLSAYDVLKPLALFTRIQDLSLTSLYDLTRAPPGTTFEQKLARYNLSRSDLDDLQIAKIHLHSESCIALDFWAAVFQQTLTPNLLRSFSVSCDRFTTAVRPSSAIFDLLRGAAATLAHITLGASHTKQRLRTGYFIEDLHDDQCAYHEFDLQEMRTGLTALTSLRSLTLKFQFHPPERSLDDLDVLSPYEAFTRMAPILASFPTCLERITFSFASPGPMLVDTYNPPYRDLHG